MTITAMSGNPSVVPNPTVNYTNPNTTGSLTFAPVTNAFGAATVTVVVHDNGGTANGGVDAITNTFTVTVNAVNQQPSFTAGANQTVLENAGAQSVANWATAISPGPTNESSQTVTFHLSNNNNGLFSVPPAVSSTGTLTYTPATNASGSATVTIYAQDNGGTANGGVDTSAAQTFAINVIAVNQPPTLNVISNLNLVENWNLQTVNLSGITPGPANESSQTLIITATSSNPSFIPNPTVNYTNPNTTGTLTFTPATNVFDSATITVIVQDNGGTANGGADSVTNTFQITETGITNYWFAGSNLTVNVFDANGGAGSGYSQTNYTGVLDVLATDTSPFTIILDSFNGGSPGAAANFDNTSNYTWTIATTTRGVIGLTTNQFIVDTGAFTNDLAGGTFSVVLAPDGNSVNLGFIPNHPPVANPVYLERALNTSLKISISNILANYTTDRDGDARLLVGVWVSTNGSFLSTNSTFILFAPTNNIPESFTYVIRDARTYRPGDTVCLATNWITVNVIQAVGYAQSLTTSGGAVTITFAGVPNYAYDVERATNVGGPWTVLYTTNAPANGRWTYTDNNPPEPMAFYRTQQH